MSNTASKQTTFGQKPSQQRSSGRAAAGLATADPTASDPTASDPTASDPTASDPTASDPTASDPAASDPAASDPAASDPAAAGQGTPELANGLPGIAATRSAARWTFLSNHAHVLAVLHSDPQLVLRQVAMEVGITERAVQRITQDLEEGGFIRREKVGRKNRYHILTNEPLRHPIEAHRKIGDLLKLISK